MIQWYRKPPSWFVPLFGYEHCSEYDGYLCGIAVRLRTDFILASSVSILIMTEQMNRSSTPGGPPGFFKFQAPDEVNVLEQNNDDWEYVPDFRYSLMGNIGLYRASVRRELGGIYPIRRRYPITNSTVFEREARKGITNCRLLSYNNIGEDGKKFEKPIRKFSAIPLVIDQPCDVKHMCVMRVDPDRKDLDDGLCGYYAEMGAPVVCGSEDQRAIRYLVTNVHVRDVETNCTPTFDVLYLPHFIDYLGEEMRRYESLPKPKIQNPILRMPG